MPEIVFIMGKSSSGKDKIFKALAQDAELDLKTVKLYTTRPMRNRETNGVEYFFVDDATAEKMQAENKVIELRCYQTIYGVWKYFTADDGQIDIRDGIYLMIGTLEAYEQVSKFYGKEHLMPIYIEVEDGIRLTRALEREKKEAQPKYAEVCRRFLADEKDFSEENLKRNEIAKKYYNNEKLDDCISEIKIDIKQQLSYNKK